VLFDEQCVKLLELPLPLRTQLLLLNHELVMLLKLMLLRSPLLLLLMAVLEIPINWNTLSPKFFSGPKWMRVVPLCLWGVKIRQD
jgi:hypothetical protein